MEFDETKNVERSSHAIPFCHCILGGNEGYVELGLWTRWPHRISSNDDVGHQDLQKTKSGKRRRFRSLIFDQRPAKTHASGFPSCTEAFIPLASFNEE